MAKYRAISLGFHIGRRRPGDVFDGPDGMKGSWFEEVADDATSEKAQRESHKDEPIALSELAKKKAPKATEPTTLSEAGAALDDGSDLV